MRGFSDSIVFVDESGDQSLTKVNPSYPMFVLSFCVFAKDEYADRVVPEVTRLKLDFFGSDVPILHEMEMRKRKGFFLALGDRSVANEFYTRLNRIMAESCYTVDAVVIDKREYARCSMDGAATPYDVSVRIDLMQVFRELQSRGQEGLETSVVFESRGHKEDRDLARTIDEIMGEDGAQGLAASLKPVWVPKSMNLAGLQFADLTARPIGVHCLRPEQGNRAWDIIEGKLGRGSDGEYRGHGLRTIP